jgi:transketolase
LLLQSVGKTGRVVTVEDHSTAAGLGGAVAEVLSEVLPTPLKRLGVTGFGESGDPKELYEKFGLSSGKIAEATAGFCGSPAEVALAGQRQT